MDGTWRKESAPMTPWIPSSWRHAPGGSTRGRTRTGTREPSRNAPRRGQALTRRRFCWPGSAASAERGLAGRAGQSPHLERPDDLDHAEHEEPHAQHDRQYEQRVDGIDQDYDPRNHRDDPGEDRPP